MTYATRLSIVRERTAAVRSALWAAAALLVLCILAPAAEAVLPGENGRILFVSGRTNGDVGAEIFMLPVPSSTGGGTLSQPIASIVGTQHRHPTWSPDRTKIAYSRGDSATANFDIYVLDVTTPGATPVNLTSSNNVTDDRPSWSPDGTRIAYESEVTDGSGQTDVLIRPAGGGAATNLTNTTAAGQFEGKPVWSPDSNTIYHQVGNPNAATNADIVKRPATGGAATLAVADSGISEFQPSISPDGTKMCFTISNAGFNNTADVMVAPLTTPPSGGIVVSKDATLGDYNCTWSPDGTLIAYVNGTFSSGQLVMVRADNTSSFANVLYQDPGGDNFDGNPEWAPDGRPECDDQTVTTPPDTPVTFTVECRDTGPQYERTNVREFSETQPTVGTLTQDLAGDPFTYAPPAGFTGTTSFQVSSFDELGFGSDEGKITIDVKAPQGPGGGDTVTCGGQDATITGTDGNDKLKGTPGNDVIAAGDGKDQVKGKSGNDRICGEGGRDKLSGGGGKDRLDGGPSKDRCSGGGGKDRAAACERTRSVP